MGLVSTVCLIAAPPCRAQERTAILELADALALARANNPALRAADARSDAMAERPIQEATLPDPMLGLRFHNESFDQITLGESEFSFVEVSLEQEVPFPGKLGLRERAAFREAGREAAMRDAAVLMVLAETASRYHDLALIQRTRELLSESASVLDLIAQQASARYSVGEVAQQDVLRASLERSALDERVTMLDQKQVAAEAGLNALLGRPATAELGRLVFTDPSALEPLAELEDRLRERAPELRAAEEEVERSAAALDLARSDYLPNFSLMGAYMNKNGLEAEWELGVRVTVPLYFWRRQRAAVAEQSHAKRAAEQARRSETLQLDARLRQLHAMASTSMRLVDLYRRSLIPTANLTLQSARASYEVGRVDVLTVVSAFTALLEYQIRAAEEQTNWKRARAEIAPLVGETPLGELLGTPP